MFSSLRRTFGLIKVTEQGNTVTVEGIPADFVARDIASVWKTSKINAWMFTKIGRNSFTFNRFFAVDIYYMLKTIKANRYRRVSSRVIDNILGALEEQTWLKRLTEKVEPRFDYSQLANFKKQPLPHQRAFLEHYDVTTQQMGLHGYMLSARAGSGKTLTDLYLAACVRAELVIVIAPKVSIDTVWTHTVNEEMKKPYDIWRVADGQGYKGQKCIIGHYEVLEKIYDAVGHHSSGNTVIILDESHNFNESTAVRSNLFVKLCRDTHCENVIWASGTPLKAMGYEMIPFLKTVDPFFDDDAEMRFRKIFGMQSGRAVDVLRNRIGLVSFKANSAAAVKNTVSRHDIHVKIPDSEQYTLDAIRQEMSDFIVERLKYYQQNMKKYEQIYKDALEYHAKTLESREERKAFDVYNGYIKDIRKYYDPETMKTESTYCNQYETKRIIPSLPTKEERDAFKDCRAVIKYVRLKVVGEALGRVLGKKRSACNAAMIPHLGLEDILAKAAKKTVIFTSYVDVVKVAEAYLKTKGIKSILVYGETNSNISMMVKQFAKDEHSPVLIATYQSLSTAVPLIMADQAIFLNQPFRSHEKVQAEARLDRLGQDSPVNFYNTYLDTGKEANISTRSGDILKWSEEMVAEMFGEMPTGAKKELEKDFTTGSMESYVCVPTDFLTAFNEHLKMVA